MTNKKSLAEKYTKILLDEINGGRYSSLDMLPPEKEIAETYNISRTVVRDCLGTLENEGFISRKHGIGTIINKHVVDIKVRMDLEEEFLDMVQSAGYTPGTQDINYQFIKDNELANDFGINNNEFLMVSRVITADNTPVIYCEDYISSSLIINKDFSIDDFQTPIFSFLDENCKCNVNLDVTEVKAIAANSHISKKLDTAFGEPILFLDETGYTLHGKPILHSKEYYKNGYMNHMILRRKI